MVVRGLKHISSPSGETETTGAAQPGEGRLCCYLQLSTGRAQTRGNQTVCCHSTSNIKHLPNLKHRQFQAGQKLFHQVVDGVLEQAAQTGGGVSVLGAIQHLAAQALMQPALISLALGMKLD